MTIITKLIFIHILYLQALAISIAPVFNVTKRNSTASYLTKRNSTVSDIHVTKRNSTNLKHYGARITAGATIAASGLSLFYLTDRILNKRTKKHSAVTLPPTSTFPVSTENEKAPTVQNEEMTPEKEVKVKVADTKTDMADTKLKGADIKYKVLKKKSGSKISEKKARKPTTPPVAVPVPSIFEKEYAKLGPSMAIMEALTRRIKNDRDFIVENLSATDEKCEILQVVEDSIKNDKAYFLNYILPKNTWCFQYASDSLKDDIDVVSRATEGEITMFRYASERIRNDRVILKEIISTRPNLGGILEYATPLVKNDFLLAQEMVKLNGTTLRYFTEPIQDHFDVVVSAIRQNAAAYVFASERIRTSQDFVLKIVADVNKDQDYHRALDIIPYIWSQWRKDRPFVFQILQIQGTRSWALQYFDDELKDDEKFAKRILVANEKGFKSYQFLSERLRNREDIYNLVKHHAETAQFIGEELQKLFANREEEERKREQQTIEMDAIVQKRILEERRLQEAKQREEKRNSFGYKLRGWLADMDGSMDGWMDGLA